MSCKTNGDGMKIHFGLINGANKYLTAESFGFKVNASGTSMKKKQIWTMEQEAEDGGAVFFKSHLGRYLAADRNGNISCDAEERDDGDCRFVVQAQADGKWAIQSQTHGRYLGGSEDRLSCFAQSMGPSELWSVHLAMHPQVNLFHVGRKRYAQLLEHELAVNADVPWGVTSLVTLDFHERRYLLKTSDNQLLLGDGSLVREPSSEALFTLEFVGGKVAFRDCQGRFLSAVGPRGSLKSSKAAGKAGKNEVFELQESRPQVVLRASNGRNVSTKQSTELSANQDEETEHETFQMEMEQDSQRFAFRTFSGKYWVLGPGGIQASVSQPNKDSWFDMEWHGRQVALKAPNGKYVAPRKNGQLAAQADIAGEVEKFVLKIINRPLLVLRGEYGFMGVRKGSPALDGNRSSHDVFQLHFADGAYTIQDGAGRSWVVDDQGAVSLGPDGTPFLLQLCNNGRLALQAPNGRYVGSDQAGRVTANGEEPTGANTWEF